MYIVDTNAVSELRKSEKADANVLKWASLVPVAQFYLSATTAGYDASSFVASMV